MAYRETIQHAAKKIAFLFSKGAKKLSPHEKAHRRQQYMKLNFHLLSRFLKKEKAFSNDSPLFTAKMLTSKNKHLSEMIKQARSCCSKQDLHLFSYKQFYYRNEFSMRYVIEWKLSKYIQNKRKLNALIRHAYETPPDAFKHHLVKLLKKEQKETKDFESSEEEEKWKVWQSRGGGGDHPISISPP